ncbi:MAG: LysR family transcriptional regulator [Hyphomicrobiales bacterium]
MARFTLKHIEAFVWVAELGTFRRAAERLGTTQPNISGRIAQLEAQLGVTLLDRDAGSVRLTPHGEALLPKARDILAAVDRFVEATGEAAIVEGVLRLGVSEMVAHTFLRPFLVAMKERYPSVDVELTIDLSKNLSQALFERDLDLVFQSGPFDRSARCTIPLGQSDYAWVAAPALAIPAHELGLDEIAAHPVLTHARGTVPFQQLDQHFRDSGRRARLVPSSNLATCLQMALDGLGIACLPEAMVTEALAEGRLRRLNYGWTPDALQFAARYLIDPAPAYVREAAQLAQTLYPPDHKS